MRISVYRSGILIAVVAGVFAPLVVRSGYILHLLVMALINCILVASLNLTLGYAGLPHFGHAAFYGLGAYAAAIAATRFGASFIPATFLSLAVSGLAGCAIGSVALRLRGPYFCITTIGFAEILRIIADNHKALTGGTAGIPGIPAAAIFGISLVERVHYYYLALFLLVVTLVLIDRFVDSVAGRAWVSCRENEQLALSVGVNVHKYYRLAFTIGAMLAGLAGSVYVHYICYVSPELLLFRVSSMMVLMTVIGGKGTLWGPVVGAGLFTLVPEYLRIAEDWRLILFGAILVVTVVFLPRGIIYLPRRIIRAVRRAEA